MIIRIDVDTYRGLEKGLPRLIDFLSKLNITATIMVPAGPDRSGLAMKRGFHHMNFLRKMARLNAIKTYGFRTLLSGTVLPAKNLFKSGASVLREIGLMDYEIGLHGYDHFYWQDMLDTLPIIKINKMITDGIMEFEDILDYRPKGFAAPGWICNDHLLAVIDNHHFVYASDCRGASPFIPLWEKQPFKTIQLPTTLPTLDELLPEMTEDEAYFKLNQLLPGQNFTLHVIHAEIEGIRYFTKFSDWLRKLIDDGVKFQRMDQFVNELDYSILASNEIYRGSWPVRYNKIAIQKV